MPAPSLHAGVARTVAGVLVSGLIAACATAQPQRSAQTSATSGPAAEDSGLDARLFYQLLIGEMEFRAGQAGTAYQVMLDAAKRTGSEQVFRRATDIALQARAGEQALAAVLAWREALPESTEALRYQIQLLVALNRVAGTLEPLSALLRLTPAMQRPALIDALPRLFGRNADRKGTAELLAQALAPHYQDPATRIDARVAVARAWLAALDTDKALELAQAAHATDPKAAAPALLALEMLPGTTGAERIVTDYLANQPSDSATRLLYVRVLTGSQRFADARSQLNDLIRTEPKLAAPWLTLGALQLEMRQPADATAALTRYVDLVQSGEAASPGGSAPGTGPAAAAAGSDGDRASAAQGLTQAWLMLAQAAEQQRDDVAAEKWLARIDDPQRALDVQLRRASMLARQGKQQEARDLIRRLPEQTSADARGKLLAESQLLREQKAWGEAEKVLAQANQRFPEDVDLLYEQAMMAEKLDRLEDMERLLRRVIELKPDHHHAYNALGYSLAERNVRLPEARQLVARALELSPGEPFITDSLGWVEYRLGNHAEALRLLRSAYRSRPDPEIAAHLGEVLFATGRVDEALQIWREGRARDAGNDVLKETLARLRVEL